MAVLLLLHVPPLPVVVKVVVAPAHTGDVPDNVPAEGEVITDTVMLAIAVPQLLLTV